MASKAGGFDLAKPGKFKVSVGKSLRHSDDEVVPDSYSNVQYNVGYEELANGLDGNINSHLESSADGQYSLQLKGLDDATIAKYAGSQRAARKLECVLIYSPDTNSFTLERLASTFTFNREIPDTDEAPLSASATIDNTGKHQWKIEDPLIEDAEEMTADVENPFDVRHFLQKPKEEETSEEEEDDDGDDRSDLDDDFEKTFKDNSTSQIEGVATPGVEKTLAPTPQTAAPTSVPKPKPAPKRGPKKSANPFMPPEKTKPRPTGRSPLPGSTAFTGRQGHLDIRDSSMSPSAALPSPAHVGLPRSLNSYHTKPAGQDSASESDEDESDEDESDDNTHHRSLQTATNMSRQPSGTGSILSRNEPDVFVLDVPKPQQRVVNEESDEDADGEDDEVDLEALMEQEFGSGDDSIVMEGENTNPVANIGLGINNVNAGGPVASLSSIVGGSRRDESEESSSEEE